MSKQARLEPRWLVSLLSAWAQRSLAEQTRAVGWYSICPMLQSGIPGKARSYEPTGYSDQDFTDVEAAFAELTIPKQLAIIRYFRPTMKAAIDRENNYPPIMWGELFSDAFKFLAVRLNAERSRANRR